MIYSMNDPNLLDAVDRYKTGNYGEDYFDDSNEEYEKCECCGKEFYRGDIYYDVPHVGLMCEDCFYEWSEDCKCVAE